MKIGLIVAMQEELTSLNSIITNNNLIDKKPHEAISFKYHNHEIVAVISGIGKAAASSATTLLILNHNCDIIINVGSCGGLSEAFIGSVIVSNQTAYGDVDVTAFGYQIGQIPGHPPIFISPNNNINYEEIFQKIQSKNHTIFKGMIISNDSFINDINVINKIKKVHPNSIAVEMESSAIAQICNIYNKDFLLVKKVSDMADKKASQNFKEEIKKMEETTSTIIKDIIDNI